MHETGCSGLVHWDDPEGWDGEEGGRGVGIGGGVQRKLAREIVAIFLNITTA